MLAGSSTIGEHWLIPLRTVRAIAGSRHITPPIHSSIVCPPRTQHHIVLRDSRVFPRLSGVQADNAGEPGFWAS